MVNINYGINPPQDYIPVPTSILNRSLVARFEDIVEAFPDRPAVKDDTKTLTYHALDVFVNNLANAILENAGRGDTAVTFLLGHDVNAIIAFLAILKAGRPFLALHLANPVDRMRMIISDAESPLLISSHEYRSIVNNIFSRGSKSHPLYIEDAKVDSQCGNPGIYVAPDFPFSLVYTSGSTGKAKGVVTSHRHNASMVLYQTDPLYFSPSDRISLYTSLSVAAGTPSMLGALMNGGLLCLYDLKKHGSQKALDWIHSDQLTIYRSTPSILRSIFNLAPKNLVLPNLRIMTLGGEPVTREDVAIFKAHTLEHCVLVNNFAAVEVGNIAHFPVSHQTQLNGEFLPAGYLAPYKEVLLLDEEGKPVKPGNEGEIAIRSRYLSSGYWKQPDLTAIKFRTDPIDPAIKTYYSGDLGRWRPDGVLEFIGRRDTHVKIRGFSVQLEAIDYLLQKIDGVKEAACATQQPTRGGKRIVAYLVPAKNRKLSVTDIREALSSQLPDYMVPSVFVWLETLPRTVTGKISRMELPTPSGARPDLPNEFVAPRNQEEALVAQLWCDLLQLESVGVEDNFFELGGDSLSALSMNLEVEKQTGKTISQAFFQEPTIAHLVKTLGQDKTHLVTGEMVSLQKSPAHIGRHPQKRISKFEQRKRRHRLVSKRFWQDGLILAAPIFYRRTLLSKQYSEGNHWLSRWCKRPIVAHGIYQAQYRLFCQMIASMDKCTLEPDSIFPAFLMGNILRGTISSALPEDYSMGVLDKLRESKTPYCSSLVNLIENSSLAELDNYFSISGQDNLERAYQKSKGVIILTYHSTMNMLAIAGLPRRINCGPITTVSHRVAARQSPDWQDSAVRDIPLIARSGLNAAEALQAQHFLLEGKIIQLVTDGDPGGGISHHLVAVAGRQYYLPSGFAELALNTEAIIVPEYTTIRADGRVHTTFLPPLMPEPGNWDYKIEGLMGQLANFLTSSWIAAPESMNWSRMRKHFRCPPAKDATSITN
jgi:acyl-coenzyme A synthetase/AMP-(fatty) acid ligase/lauroyl/myristoyl acyltransferase